MVIAHTEGERHSFLTRGGSQKDRVTYIHTYIHTQSFFALQLKREKSARCSFAKCEEKQPKK
jgi:hypothetical protein